MNLHTHTTHISSNRSHYFCKFASLEVEKQFQFTPSNEQATQNGSLLGEGRKQSLAQLNSCRKSSLIPLRILQESPWLLTPLYLKSLFSMMRPQSSCFVKQHLLCKCWEINDTQEPTQEKLKVFINLLEVRSLNVFLWIFSQRRQNHCTVSDNNRIVIRMKLNEVGKDQSRSETNVSVHNS